MKTYLEISEIELIKKQATNLRDRLLIQFLFHLGCRVSEALNTSVDNIDFISGTVTIQHLKIRLQLSCPECSTGLSRRHAFCPNCGIRVADLVTKEKEHRRQRVLPLDKETLEMLKEFIEQGGPVECDGKILIFGINRHRAWQIIKECSDKAGIPKLINSETGKTHHVSPHRLRDAFAVHAMKLDDSGNGMRLLQNHLGHASFNTTAKYRKIASDEQNTWYHKLWD